MGVEPLATLLALVLLLVQVELLVDGQIAAGLEPLSTERTNVRALALVVLQVLAQVGGGREVFGAQRTPERFHGFGVEFVVLGSVGYELSTSFKCSVTMVAGEVRFLGLGACRFGFGW